MLIDCSPASKDCDLSLRFEKGCYCYCPGLDGKSEMKDLSHLDWIEWMDLIIFGR